MPIAARWRRVDKLPAPRSRDAMPGVYEIADDRKHTIYVGHSAQDVPNRIRQHLSRPGCIADRGTYWRYAFSRVPRSHEADLVARYRERNGGELPPCNTATPKLRPAHRRSSERFQSDE